MKMLAQTPIETISVFLYAYYEKTESDKTESDKTEDIHKKKTESDKTEDIHKKVKKKKKTESDKTEDIHKKVKKLVNKLYRDGVISDDLKQYLTPRYAGKGKLKGNPKLHKPNAPYRTIVSGIGTPTEKLAEFAEHELTECVETSPSYIRDTTDFISKLKEIGEPLPENAVLFCFDVAKLYPSVPRKEGLEACEEALSMRSEPLAGKDGVMEMIKMVLENNVFGFGETNYLQKEGIAIGSRLGKNFACTYMRKWDEALLQSEIKPYFYKRFIDDGFGIWTGSIEELKQFTDHANSIHENIQVELRYDQKQIEFLDTLVKIENGHIYTDLYVKPTDKQLYLTSSSCHPSSTKKGLAYGLGLRIRRICEKESDYQRHRKELKNQLRKRGYSGNLIEEQLKKVDVQDRSELLKVNRKEDKNSKRVPLVVTYSNLLPDIQHITKKHLDVLHRSSKMRDVFKDPPIVAFRRDKNLSDVLVHGKTNKALKSTRLNCKPGCGNCSIISRETVSDTSHQNKYTPVSDINCQSRNVIYGIICTSCKSTVYVGETERQLRERMTEHLRDVRLRRDKPINVHFNQGEHSQLDMGFVVLEKLYNAERTERQLREGLWIKELRTVRPDGCNVKDSDISVSFWYHKAKVRE